jgi:hypothetical protein
MNWDHVHVHLLLDVLVIAIVYFDLVKEDHEYFPTNKQKQFNLIEIKNSFLRCIFLSRKLEQEIVLIDYD